MPEFIQGKMTTTTNGSQYGCKVESFEKGQVYNFTPELFEQFEKLEVVKAVKPTKKASS